MNLMIVMIMKHWTCWLGDLGDFWKRKEKTKHFYKKGTISENPSLALQTLLVLVVVNKDILELNVQMFKNKEKVLTGKFWKT